MAPAAPGLVTFQQGALISQPVMTAGPSSQQLQQQQQNNTKRKSDGGGDASSTSGGEEDDDSDDEEVIDLFSPHHAFDTYLFFLIP